MGKRLVFSSDLPSDESELQFYENDKGLLFIEVGNFNQNAEAPYYSGCICLSKENVKIFIDELQRIYEQLP